jgi:hypothetical protein
MKGSLIVLEANGQGTVGLDYDEKIRKAVATPIETFSFINWTDKDNGNVEISAADTIDLAVGTSFDLTANFQQTAILSVSPTTLNINSAEGSTTTFTVTSNTNWTVSSGQDWLSVIPSSGNGSGTVIVTANANTATTERNATVTVSAIGAASQEVKVIQPIATGLKEMESAKWSVYPNPFSDGFYIEAGNGKTTVSVYTVNGWMLFKTDISGNKYIPMRLACGNYMVELTNGKEIVRRKLVK